MPDPAREFADPSNAASEHDAIERFVRRHQMEAQLLAYLMRGDSGEGLDLARRALGNCMRAVVAGDDVPDLRLRLLEELGRLNLEFNRPRRTEPHAAPAGSDERQRIEAALEIIDMPVRQALVLCDVGALSDQEACRITGLEAAAVRLELGAARQRLRDAAGIGGRGSAFEPLARLLRDAPQYDLWPQIEERYQQLTRRRQQRTRLVSASFVTMAAIVLIGGFIWLTGFSLGGSGDAASGSTAARPTAPIPTADPGPDEASRALDLAVPTPTPAAPIELVGDVPDLQLLTAIEQAGEQRVAAYTFDPSENSAEPLASNGSIVLISPDGRWLVFQQQRDDGTVRLSVARPEDAEVAWRLDTPRVHAAVIHHDRLILGRYDSDETRLTLTVLDITSGEERVRWVYSGDDLEIAIGHQFKLFAAPDGERVYLMAEAYEVDGDVWMRTLAALDAESGAVLQSWQYEASQMDGDLVPDFDLRRARLTVDGSAIYSQLIASRERILEIVFIDVESGAREAVSLPFDMRDDPWFVNVHAIPSNTGRFLYVLYPDRQQMAIVDLLARELKAIMTIGPQSFGRVGFENRLWQGTTYLVATFSPDGTRLYLSVVWEKNPSFRSSLNRSSVWVIETQNWQIIDTWSIPGQPSTLTTSGDGSEIYLSYEAARGGMAFIAFDARDGEVLYERSELPMPEWANIPRITSLMQLYQDHYGWMPAVDGVAPADAEDTRMLPAVALDIGETGLIAGEPTEVEISFRHPITGEVLASESSDVRFSPEARLNVFFSGPDGALTGLAPTQESPGVYSGKVALGRAGEWHVRMSITNQDGSTWTLEAQQSIEVVAGLTSEDGAGFQLHVRPENPVSRRTLTLRGWLIDTDTFETLDEDDPRLPFVPDTIDLMLYSEFGGYISTTIERLEGGRYLGWARFESPGRWRALAAFQLTDGTEVRIDAGEFEVTSLAGTELERNRDPIEEESRRRSTGGWPSGR